VSVATGFITDIPVGAPGSLAVLMDTLTELQKLLVDLPALADMPTRIRPYRWRPDSPDPPCIYNVLLPSSSEQKDLIRVRDTMVIATRIGQSYSDSEQAMDAVEKYADAYRALVDVNYWDGQRVPPVIAGGATWAMRQSMQSYQENFGSVTLSGIEFVQQFWLDRHVR
jgi:hypothetical protein